MGDLTQEATIRNFRMVQREGSRDVAREVQRYRLQAIIAVGFKVENDLTGPLLAVQLIRAPESRPALCEVVKFSDAPLG